MKFTSKLFAVAIAGMTLAGGAASAQELKFSVSAPAAPAAPTSRLAA
jgi:hypothetical protein